jgi:hypothetical protein
MARLKIGESVDYPAATDRDSRTSNWENDDLARQPTIKLQSVKLD